MTRRFLLPIVVSINLLTFFNLFAQQSWNVNYIGGYHKYGNTCNVFVVGNYAYLANDYGGLRIVDVSNPASLQEVGYYDTGSEARGVYVNGSYAYVADWGCGLYILKHNPTGHLTYSNTKLNFGNVSIGISDQQMITLTNNGAGNVIVYNTSIGGVNASEFSSTSGEGMLALTPSKSNNFSVMFTPQNPFIKQAYFITQSDAPNIPDTLELVDSDVSTPQGLIAYYPFNGNVNDATGNGSDGVAKNGTQITNRAIFDGIDDEIEINPATLLQTVTGGSHSFSIWIKLASKPINNKFVVDMGDYGHDQRGIRFEGNSKPIFKWVTSTGSYKAYSTQSLLAGKWYHLVGVLNGNEGKIYVNGNLLGSSTSSGIPDNSNLTKMKIGNISVGGTGNGQFHGELDDIKIYNHALSENEITALFNEKPDCVTWNQLVAYYPFNGNANDESGNGINGTVYGAVLTTDRFGNANSAYYFDGYSDYIDLNDNSSLNLTSDLTLAAWIYPEYNDSYQKILTREVYGKGAYRFVYDGYNDAIRLYQGTTLDATFSSNGVIQKNQWNFVAVTREGSGTTPNSVKFYVNGVFINSAKFTQAPQSVNENTSISQNTGKFIGKIDDVRFYDTVLSEFEIQQLYYENGWTGGGNIVRINNTPTIGSNVDLTVTPPQSFNPTITRLYYRPAGERNWNYTTLINTGSAFEGSIPSNMVTERGLEYYVYLSDGQTIISYPETDPENHPAFLAIQVTQMPANISFSSQEYKMVSVPIELQDPSINNTLEDDYGSYDINRWRLFYWYNGSYQEYPGANNVASFIPGTAFWLITSDGSGFDVENGVSVDATNNFIIELRPGWNQIGDPFAFPVAWDSIGGSELVQAPVWWNGSDYEYNQTTLQPWEGYFVYNPTGQTVQLSVPPRESQGRMKKSGAFISLMNGECTLQLEVEGLQTHQRDTENYVGMLYTAADGLDARDFLTAPPIENSLTLDIVEQGKSYAGNFKAVNATGATWDLVITSSSENETVRLSVRELSTLPEGFRVWLMDTDRRCVLSLNGNKAEVQMDDKNVPRHLRLILGTEEFAKQNNQGIPLVPLDFALQQNYPNPFNPETHITYQLPERCLVHLEIYNSVGQKVRTLVNKMQDTGIHTVVWDGRNDWGLPVASGVYLYCIKAGNFSKTGKMILIR